MEVECEEGECFQMDFEQMAAYKNKKKFSSFVSGALKEDDEEETRDEEGSKKK